MSVAGPEGDGSPAARWGHGLVWSPPHGGAVLRGGVAPGRSLDATWRWDGGATTRPAHQLHFVLPAEGLAPGVGLERCEAAVIAGALGYDRAAARSGARLLFWADGRWAQGEARDDGVDGSGQPRLGALTLSVEDAEVRRRLLYGPQGELAVAVVPVAPNGQERAQVVTDYASALLRYRVSGR